MPGLLPGRAAGPAPGMKIVAATDPVVVQCPRCYSRLLLHHAQLPAYLDLAASLRGDIVAPQDPLGVQVALALHVRDCAGGVDPDGDPDGATGDDGDEDFGESEPV